MRHTTHPAPGTPARPLATAPAGVVPGLAVCAVATGVSLAVHRLVPAVSPLLVAIVVGAVAANVADLPGRWRPGLDFSARRVLRVGIALLGLQLLIGDVLGLGGPMIATVVAVVGLGIAGSLLVGARLGLSWSQRVLIACGFSICGAAAVAAVNGVVDADEDDVLTSVALVVVFGTLMIPAVPLLAGALGMSDVDAGLWAGASVHEVGQVVAAGGVIGGGALAVAVVAKLARVVMLAPVIAILGVHRRITEPAADTRRPPVVPLFVVAFTVLVAVRSTGVIPDPVLAVTTEVQTALLTAAMFALGTGVRFAALTRVGAKPFVLASFATVWVASIALAGVLLSGASGA
ncbi:YeiH family protein [Rhodococcus yananensis]|uniref:YeiH family protein n=2 Tax=Rhodococcus TaxID=1827 RepID=UPI003EBA58F4